MAFRLAWQFGCTVGELYERMGAKEFRYWVGWSMLADDWQQTAAIQATIYGSQGVKCSASDFLPRVEEKDWRQLQLKFKAMAANGGQINRQGESTANR